MQSLGKSFSTAPSHCAPSSPRDVSAQPRTPAAWSALITPVQVCLDKKLTTAEDLRAAAEQLEARSGSNLGAKLTVKAWTDPAFKVAACLVQAYADVPHFIQDTDA